MQLPHHEGGRLGAHRLEKVKMAVLFMSQTKARQEVGGRKQEEEDVVHPVPFVVMTSIRLARPSDGRSLTQSFSSTGLKLEKLTEKKGKLAEIIGRCLPNDCRAVVQSREPMTQPARSPGP